MATRKTKKQLEEELKDLEDQRNKLAEEIRRIRSKDNKAFAESAEKIEMERKIRYFKNLWELELNAAEEYAKKNKQLQIELDQQTQPDFKIPKIGYLLIADKMKNRIKTLETENTNQAETIRKLRNIIDDLSSGEATSYHYPPPKTGTPGRPRNIDEKTRRRIRKLRKEGYTIRQIAEDEGVSIGSVSNILQKKENKK